jgi:hypothetical protein
MFMLAALIAAGWKSFSGYALGAGTVMAVGHEIGA